IQQIQYARRNRLRGRKTRTESSRPEIVRKVLCPSSASGRWHSYLCLHPASGGNRNVTRRVRYATQSDNSESLDDRVPCRPERHRVLLRAQNRDTSQVVIQEPEIPKAYLLNLCPSEFRPAKSACACSPQGVERCPADGTIPHRNRIDDRRSNPYCAYHCRFQEQGIRIAPHKPQNL